MACDPDGEVVTQVNKRERKMEGILGFSLVCLKKWREGKCRGWGFSTRTQQFSSVWIVVKKIRELRVNKMTNLPLVYSSESLSSHGLPPLVGWHLHIGFVDFYGHLHSLTSLILCLWSFTHEFDYGFTSSMWKT